jgi:hypothetical protein
VRGHGPVQAAQAYCCMKQGVGPCAPGCGAGPARRPSEEAAVGGRLRRCVRQRPRPVARREDRQKSRWMGVELRVCGVGRSCRGLRWEQAGGATRRYNPHPELLAPRTAPTRTLKPRSPPLALLDLSTKLKQPSAPASRLAGVGGGGGMAAAPPASLDLAALPTDLLDRILSSPGPSLKDLVRAGCTCRALHTALAVAWLPVVTARVGPLLADLQSPPQPDEPQRTPQQALRELTRRMGSDLPLDGVGPGVAQQEAIVVVALELCRQGAQLTTAEGQQPWYKPAAERGYMDVLRLVLSKGERLGLVLYSAAGSASAGPAVCSLPSVKARLICGDNAIRAVQDMSQMSRGNDTKWMMKSYGRLAGKVMKTARPGMDCKTWYHALRTALETLQWPRAVQALCRASRTLPAGRAGHHEGGRGHHGGRGYRPYCTNTQAASQEAAHALRGDEEDGCHHNPGAARCRPATPPSS